MLTSFLKDSEGREDDAEPAAARAFMLCCRGPTGAETFLAHEALKHLVLADCRDLPVIKTILLSSEMFSSRITLSDIRLIHLSPGVLRPNEREDSVSSGRRAGVRAMIRFPMHVY